MRLNKYIAHSGYCSRRKADQLIFDQKVLINDVLILNPATFVAETDIVLVDNQRISLTEQKLYYLLNKPLYTVSTAQDEKNRSTVVDIIKTDYRIYPIGRLDYMTTGILLLTNDGILTQKLSHPSTEIKKTYAVQLRGEITDEHLAELKSGVSIDNRITYPAKISHIVKQNNTSDFQIEIHEGRNRQIRKMIDILGYTLLSLDRIRYGSLTYSDLERGEYRPLTASELNILTKLAGIN